MSCDCSPRAASAPARAWQRAGGRIGRAPRLDYEQINHANHQIPPHRPTGATPASLVLVVNFVDCLRFRGNRENVWTRRIIRSVFVAQHTIRKRPISGAFCAFGAIVLQRSDSSVTGCNDGGQCGDWGSAWRDNLRGAKAFFAAGCASRWPCPRPFRHQGRENSASAYGMAFGSRAALSPGRRSGVRGRRCRVRRGGRGRGRQARLRGGHGPPRSPSGRSRGRRRSSPCGRR